MDLKQKTIENTFIVFIVTFFNRGLNIITKILLARLLLPEDFGLIAIAMIIINAISLFREMGIESALIYRKTDIKKASDTIFIILPFIGVGLYVIAFLIAPYAAEFYEEILVKDIIRISGIVLILTSFSSVPVTLFAKDLNFKKRMTPEVVSNISYTILTLFLAKLGFGVWSLVYGGVISGVIGIITIWSITSYRPALRFDRKIALEMLNYGKYILGAQLVIFVLINIDTAVVGKILDMRMLGFYTIAYSIANIPATNITHILGKILFPTYSRLQDDMKRFNRFFLTVVRYVSFLTVPSAFFLFALAPDLVAQVIGVKWAPSIIPLRILCVGALLRSITATTGVLFNAIGKPKLLQDISLVQLFFMIAFIIPATTLGGLVGVSILMSTKNVLAFGMSFYVVSRNTEMKLRQLYDSMKTQFSSSILSVASVFLLGTLIPQSLIGLIVKTILFCGVYILSFSFMDKKIFYEIWSLLRYGTHEFKKDTLE